MSNERFVDLLSAEELRNIVHNIWRVLWGTDTGVGVGWDADKEWSPDTLDEIAQVMDAYSLRPNREEESP